MIVTNCLECGEPVPYQGKGRPRTRHVRCMTPNQKRDRAYMKSYMPKYYERPGNREKHNQRCVEYLERREVKSGWELQKLLAPDEDEEDEV